MSADNEIVVTRVIDAPRALVFKAWTEPERLMRWWAPKGWTTRACKVDLRPGGVFHYCMRSPEGQDAWGRGVYREITAPERIVYTDSFSDESGNVVEPTHYGLSADYPTEAQVTVTLTEQEGRTKLVLQHAIPASAPARAECEQGWIEMLERLEALVATA